MIREGFSLAKEQRKELFQGQLQGVALFQNKGDYCKQITEYLFYHI
jgi:hypothetical protein